MTAASEGAPVKAVTESEKPKADREPVFRNADLFRLRDGLIAVGDLPGAKFAKVLAKNLRRVRMECQDLEKAKAPSKEYLVYDKKRIELILKHADKDEGGQPKMTENRQGCIVNKQQATLMMAMLKLRDEHKPAIEEHDTKLAEYAELLEEKADEIKFFTISSEQVPKEITGNQYDAIFEIIDDQE